MRLKGFFLLGSMLFAVPVWAQPPGGPWGADANGDGQITREEMRAWMEHRFALMDPDGDGLVPVEAMQRMLGHERQKEADAADGGERRGRGGPPPGERPAGGGKRAEGPPPGPPGAAMPYPEDGNDDGKIDATEFVAPAMAMFGEMDVNGDGVLSADELPPPPP